MARKLKIPKLLSKKDNRFKNEDVTHKDAKKKKKTIKTADATQIASTTMYLNYNQSLGPPFQIICDTNFINFSVRNKMDIKQCLMDCLLAKVTPFVTECVMAELQKLGSKFKLALKTAKQFEVLTCMHKGVRKLILSIINKIINHILFSLILILHTYADDCIVNRVQAHKCYIVGTCDRDLKRRIRKIPGIPIMFISKKQYAVERMPEKNF